jgi:hypothetical protein
MCLAAWQPVGPVATVSPYCLPPSPASCCGQQRACKPARPACMRGDIQPHSRLCTAAWFFFLSKLPSTRCPSTLQALESFARAQVLRIFRLTRVFRILKLGHRFQKLQIVTQALSDSSDVMFMLSFVLGLTILVFATLVFEAERSVFSKFDPTTHAMVRSDRRRLCFVERCAGEWPHHSRQAVVADWWTTVLKHGCLARVP